MRTIAFIAGAALFAGALTAPLQAQPAPAGWSVQAKTSGARTFTPPDLRAGEVFSVTIYNAAPLGGKSPGDYLREFAGPVGNKPGQLAAPFGLGPLAAGVSGTGIYRGPNGALLAANFYAFSFDGGRHIAVARVLASHQSLVARYTEPSAALIDKMRQRAQTETRAQPAPAVAESNGGREAALKARGEAEDSEVNRRRFGTAPGKGIALSQIALVLHDSRLVSNGMSTFIRADEYLLLRDGTVHRGFSVPPDELDLSKSRRGEPENWGKWRRKGADFEVSWQGKAWETLGGEAVQPGAAGTRLAGRFGAGSGSSGAGMSSYGFWGVTFDASGRFRKDSRGGTSSGTSAGAQSAGVPTISITRDDNGSTATASVPGATVTSQTRKNPNGNNEGTYQINGYTLSLRYDNGRVVRQPFFFYGAKRQGVWFEDSLLFRDEK